MGTSVCDLRELDLFQAAKAIASGSISAEALAIALLDIARQHEDLNAFVSISTSVIEDARAADRALRDGKPLGPLHGVPIALKDNINTRAMATTGGTPSLADHRPTADAPVARALFEAGAILFGKNTMQELAFGVTCRETPNGPVVNPCCRNAIPGGSSGGTAAAVAARIVPAGIGTDTGGSVRIPAALCGLAGYRPSIGRWPAGGILPISHTRDTPGPIARTVRDLALLDVIVIGSTDGLPIPCDLAGVRLGLPGSYFWEGLDSDVEDCCLRAVEALRHAGATIVPVDMADIGRRNADVSFVVALHEPREDITRYLADSGSTCSFDDLLANVNAADVRQIAASMRGEEAAVRAACYDDVVTRLRPALQAEYERIFTHYDLSALVFPTTPLPARAVDERNIVSLGNEELPVFPTYIRNTDPGSNAGLPGVTIDAGRSGQGLPIGLALDGPAGTDRHLLSVAMAVEAVIGQSIRPI